MPTFFYCAPSPAKLALWRAQLRRVLPNYGQVIEYASGQVALCLVTPLGRRRPLTVVLEPPLAGPALDEQIADELAARSLVEDTRVPRRWTYLGYVWTVNSISHPARMSYTRTRK